MTKSEGIVAALRNRLAKGDYDLRPFPAERDLALEFAISYMTARKVVAQLLGEGLLARSGRGRAVPAAGGRGGRPLVTLLAHGWPVRPFLSLHRALQQACQAHGLACSHQRFTHWDDPTVNHALAGSQGVLVLPPADDLPAAVVERIAGARARTAIVGADLSEHGIRGLDHLPAASVRLLLDHLAGRGHRRLAVLNVQPHDHAIRARLAEVQVWARAHLPVEVVDRPVASGEDALEPARAAAAAMLERADHATACIGTTLFAAQGLLRAGADRGLAAGPDFAVAAMDGEHMAGLLVPSITSVDSSGLAAAAQAAVAWMAGREAWEAPLFRRCQGVLVERESTAGRR